MSRVTFARCLRRIERSRIEPDFAKAFANLLVAEVFKIDAEGLSVRELSVVLSLPGKIRIDLDAMADVADEDERRPAMRGGQGAGVFFRLAPGVEHQHVPGAICAASAARSSGISAVNRSCWPATLLGALQAALLGLQNEAVPLVEVDPPLRVAFVPMLLDGPFEDVIVVLVGGIGRIRRRQSQQCDQFVEERDVVRTLLAALAALPAPDKRFYGFGIFDFPHWRNLAGGRGWAQPCAGQ